MTMTPEEIARHYVQAANKTKDIKILADLNCVSPSEIRAVLAQAGVEGVEAPKRILPKKPASPPPADTSEAPSAAPGPPEVYSQTEAILAALPEGASAAVRRRAADLLSGLFEEYLAERLCLREEDFRRKPVPTE